MCPLGQHLPTKIQTWITRGNALKPINVFLATGAITKNRHPCHNLPQDCRGSKYVFPVWIRPTENLQSHPRTSFRINEHWYNKYDTHKSTINKISLERRPRRRFYIKQNKTPKNNTWWINNWINNNNLYRFNCSFRNEE